MYQAPPITQAFERAARIACNKLGQDPDDMIAMPHPVLAGVAEHVPRWVSVATQMGNLAIMMTSMQEAAQTAVAVQRFMNGQH